MSRYIHQWTDTFTCEQIHSLVNRYIHQWPYTFTSEHIHSPVNIYILMTVTLREAHMTSWQTVVDEHTFVTGRTHLSNWTSTECCLDTVHTYTTVTLPVPTVVDVDVTRPPCETCTTISSLSWSHVGNSRTNHYFSNLPRKPARQMTRFWRLPRKPVINYQKTVKQIIYFQNQQRKPVRAHNHSLSGHATKICQKYHSLLGSNKNAYQTNISLSEPGKKTC